MKKRDTKRRASATAKVKKEPGRIITFYSYKGGTGRSMALANVAWILASAGKQVLVIDWDLEAPGLHRYFRPFLPDPELADTPGLIDFLAEFVEGSRHQALAEREEKKAARAAEPWFESYTDLLACAFSLDHEFPEGGTLDFVPAGRQGPTYAALVSTFQWTDFYERLGGGVFLEAVKKQLQAAYDYVLIDSRTGLSDTSGICTVQMPDDLVVCFTMNRQSISGAAGAADSALRLRQKPSGSPGLRVWPVPTRIDQTEKDKLELARTLARESFTRHLWHLTRTERSDYWGRIEVFYVPYYAYFEVLAVAADRPGHTGTVLRCMEQITGWITKNAVTELPKMPETARLALLARFSDAAAADARREAQGLKIYFSYSKKDFRRRRPQEIFDKVRAALPGSHVFFDDLIPLGTNVRDALHEEMRRSDIVVFCLGLGAMKSQWVEEEMSAAIGQGKQIVPVLLDGNVGFEALPKEIGGLRGLVLSESNWNRDLGKLIGGLRRLAEQVRPQVVDPEDPQRGRWGGKSKVAGREILAKVTKVSADWFSVDLRVRAVDGPPVRGTVEFHLHDTFDPDIEQVAANKGAAHLQLHAAGAFTVGALLEDGTTLELDLAELPDAPKAFRER